ncbi:tRNA adenosine(34) deaminase TadA [Marinobacterium mangrovicola]|uniref:tRNA-specific adenosine deaminase n=1 Tax=Marinobacterium mangrovicola TaxID=1476959 RepID=A0A4R1G4Z6_9GAMM|nr:tRNA adenosine(34) deaminase TadA [Marinobacterium mangrovicola]TCK03057.1 tRNA(Arg) A34 adenosine deaminase TadA [Marinobacterium mangrovicola]
MSDAGDYSSAESDRRWMEKALELAERAAGLNEVPVGALVVLDGEVVGEGWNQPISSCDPTAHAEILALRDAASRVGNYRLVGADLYVTIEPCSMCAGAIVHARIRRVVFGASEPKAGVVCSQGCFFDQSWLNHRVLWQGGVLAQRCSDRISEFFAFRREQKRLERERKRAAGD